MIFAKGGQVWKGGLYTPIFAKGAESEMVAFVLLFSQKVAKPESGSSLWGGLCWALVRFLQIRGKG